MGTIKGVTVYNYIAIREDGSRFAPSSLSSDLVNQTLFDVPVYKEYKQLSIGSARLETDGNKITAHISTVDSEGDVEFLMYPSLQVEVNDTTGEVLKIVAVGLTAEQNVDESIKPILIKLPKNRV